MALGTVSPRAATGQGALALSNAVIAFETKSLRAAGSKRSATRPRSPPRSPSISPQSTDLPALYGRYRRRAAKRGDRGGARRARRPAGAPQGIGAAARSNDRLGVHRRRALLSRLVGSRPRTPRGLRAVRQPRATSAHLAQDKFASLALASTAGLSVPPTLLMEGASEIAALGDWPGPFRLAVRETQHAGRQDRHFRRQPVPETGWKRTIGLSAYGSGIATGRSSSRSSKATTFASASSIWAAGSPISSASNGSRRTPRARRAGPF